MGPVIALVIMILILVSAVRFASRGDVLGGALIGLGATGFFSPLVLPFTGTWLQHVELPQFFETTTIRGPEGRTFAVTMPLARVQRYGSDGRFETGWFVHSAGGIIAIGLTTDGRIAVAAIRTKQVEFFNPDGSSVGPPQPCSGVLYGVLRPGYCRVDGVTFANPIQTRDPPTHWGPFVLFPLWDPFVAWLLGVSGMVLLALKHRNEKRSNRNSSERSAPYPSEPR